MAPAHLPLLFFLAVVVLGGIAPPEAVMADNNGNHMLSGQSILTGNELAYDHYKLVMQGNCNLVLENGEWESGTADKGTSCRLFLTHNGQLQILNAQGVPVWTNTQLLSKEGDYVAIVHPEGKLAVYGPTLWESKPFRTAAAAARFNSIHGRGGVPAAKTSQAVGNTRHVINALFSGQIMYNNGRLHTGVYELVMQDDCNLVMYNGGFMTNTHGNGKNCFLRLDHTGGLTILDDSYNTVWKDDGLRGPHGHYVALLQENGKFVVRGPAVWSSKPLD